MRPETATIHVAALFSLFPLSGGSGRFFPAVVRHTAYGETVKRVFDGRPAA
jgi:hypothetical protein